MSATAIVMMDTRPALLPSDLRATTIEYPQLAFELNRAYACAHGYDLLYLHQRSPTCRHQLLGERLPSYCKLAAVATSVLSRSRLLQQSAGGARWMGMSPSGRW